MERYDRIYEFVFPADDRNLYSLPQEEGEAFFFYAAACKILYRYGSCLCFCKILSQIVNLFYPFALPLDRAPYTLFAIAASGLLPFLIEFVQKYFHFEIKVESNENEEK